MAKICYDLIKSGLKTIEDVPKRWKDAVQALIDNDTEAIQKSTQK